MRNRTAVAVFVAIAAVGIWRLAPDNIAVREAPRAGAASGETRRTGEGSPGPPASWGTLPSRTSARQLAAEAGPGMFWKTVDVRGDVKALDLDASGRVWAAWGGVSAFRPGEPGAPRVFNAPSAANVKSFALDREGRFCLAQWHEAPLSCYDGTRWENLPFPGEYLRGAGVFQGRVYAASQALKEWHPRSKSWRTVEATQATIFDHFHATPWGAFLAGGTGLWVLNDPDGVGWRRLWSGQAGSEEWITSLDSDADGRIFAGTNNGFFVLDRTGRVLAHHLAGHAVTAVAARSEDRYWVSSGRDGLFFIDKGREFRFGYAEGLPSDEVRDLVVDRQGYLWFSNLGLQVARADEAEAVMRRPPTSAKTEGQIFADACAAAETLIKGKRESGQVAVEIVEGKTVVFLNGRQACPDRHRGPVTGVNAFRRADGALAVMSYNGVRFSNDCRRPCPAGQAEEMQKRWTIYLRLAIEKGPGLHRVDLPPVDPVPAETPNSEFYLDARGRLWVGTNSDGLYMFDGSRWTRFAEEARLYPHNPIITVAEDALGNIWVGSSPQFNRTSGKYLNPNLHRWNGKEWKHWSPAEGLGYWSTDSILPLKSGAMVVGTNGGLSLLDGDRVRPLGTEGKTTHYAKSMSEDPRGWLWITNSYRSNGVTLFNGSAFMTRDSRDGLFADRLRASAHDGEGRVWLLSDEGRVGVHDPRRFD